MALTVNAGLPAGTRGLWWFAQSRQNLAPPLTGDAIPVGSTYDTVNGLVLHDATGDYTDLGTTSLLIPTGAVTIILDYRCTDTTPRASAAFGQLTNTTTDRVCCDLPWSDGIVYWDFGGFTAGTTRLSVAWTKNTTRHVWAFTAGSRGMEIWRDGVKIASNAATPTRTNAGTFSLGHIGTGGSTTLSDLAEYRWVFIHETQLSEALIAAIAADPEGELTEPATALPGDAFIPAHWAYRGAVMPSRPFSEVPTGFTAVFGDHLYISYQGQYDNQTIGYSQATNVRVGSIVRTQDGALWDTVFDGAVGVVEGQRHWMPGQLFVIGSTLYAVMFSLGFNFFVNNAYIPAGEVALFKTTTGTSWTKVQTFHSWTEKNNGVAPVSVSVTALGAAWHARRSSAGGDDWIIVSWAVRCDGSTGTFFEAATQRWRSADGGATWTFVADMKGVYPFTSTPGGLDGPSLVVPVWRSPSLGDRWFMFGGSGALNWSDDEGTTWTASTFSGLTPVNAFALNSGGMVAFSHGSLVSAPDTKCSCDLGASFTTVAGYSAATPANVQVAAVQFDAAEELLVAVRDNTGSNTSLWYSTNGGETWTELGQLGTTFTVATYLGWRPGEWLILYSALVGGPQVWRTEDDPTGDVTARAICTDLTPVVETPAVVVVAQPVRCVVMPVCAEDEEPAPALAVTAARTLGTWVAGHGPLRLRRRD